MKSGNKKTSEKILLQRHVQMKTDELIEFINNEEKQLYERKRKWLKEKGDIAFFNLQSIQGQLGLLERLKDTIIKSQ